MEQFSFDKAFVMNRLEGRKMIDFVTTRERDGDVCIYLYILYIVESTGFLKGFFPRIQT